MKFSMIWQLVGLVLILSCASTAKMPEYLRNPAVHPKFTRTHYMTAIGTDTRSQNQAEMAAKRLVSEQISSDIMAVTEDELAEINRNGRIEGTQHLKSIIKTKSYFAQAQMIHCDPSSFQKIDGQFHAFAYLSRAEVYQYSKREYENRAPVFRQSAADVPYRRNDLPAFTTSFREAQEAFADLSVKAFEIQAVTRREYEAYPDDVKIYRNLEKNRTSLLRSLQLSVKVETGEAGLRNHLTAGLQDALGQLGLTATPGSCRPGRMHLGVKPLIECNSGYLGPICKLTFDYELKDCRSQRNLTEGTINSKELKGGHQRDKAIALQRLYQKLKGRFLAPLLQEELAAVLPIE